jgi:hypothetical protein
MPLATWFQVFLIRLYDLIVRLRSQPEDHQLTLAVRFACATLRERMSAERQAD